MMIKSTQDYIRHFMKNHAELKNALAVVMAVFCLYPASINGDVSKPNIVILFVDDLGWGDLNYRRDKFDTPHINTLMAEGMTFTDAYIEKQSAQKPFQMSLFYYSVHTPFVGRKDYVKKALSKNIKSRELQHAAMMSSVDESVGRIVRALKKKSLFENTLLIFLGDQGGPFDNRPLRGSKKRGLTLYEGGSRIPLIACWPGKIRPGSSSAEPIVTTDLFPTMVDIAGGDVQSYVDLDGVSICPLLKQQTGFKRDAIFLYRCYDGQYACVRSGDWKLIAYRNGKVELFNVKQDLSEVNECSAQHVAKVNELKKKLHTWEKKIGVAHYNQLGSGTRK